MAVPGHSCGEFEEGVEFQEEEGETWVLLPTPFFFILTLNFRYIFIASFLYFFSLFPFRGSFPSTLTFSSALYYPDFIFTFPLLPPSMCHPVFSSPIYVILLTLFFLKSVMGVCFFSLICYFFTGIVLSALSCSLY